MNELNIYYGKMGKIICELDEDFYTSTSLLSKRTAIPAKDVTAILRALNVEGLAFHSIGWDEDRGTPCGSGYFLSKKGAELKSKIVEYHGF